MKISLFCNFEKKYNMLFIGIAGGSGSGKTTVVKKILQSLPASSVSILSQDAYYKDNGHLSPEDRSKINFDHPDSVEFTLLVEHMDLLRNGKPVDMPIYSYITCSRSKETIPIMPKRVVIIEGILILTDETLRDRLDIKVFVDADSDDRLIRIIRRDIEERGRSFSQVLDHYETWVKPMYHTFIEPTKRFADIIVPQGGSNLVAIDILSRCINQKLHE
jgi:uridine kinase